jgi:ATP-dependent DNA helicase RecG
VQFLRINGSELTDEIIDQKEISGTLQDQIRQTEELMKLNITAGAQVTGDRRIEARNYPIEALVQIFRNALLHRSYETSHAPVKVYWFNDRIEFHNSGGLYGDVTPETIWRHATIYRNPLIAEGLKALGYVERFGLGLELAQKSLKQNANPDLVTEFVATFVQFIVKARQ